MLPTGCVNRVVNCRSRVQIRDTLLLTYTNILKFNFPNKIPVFSPLHCKRNKTYLNIESHDFHFDVTPTTLYFRNDVKTCMQSTLTSVRLYREVAQFIKKKYQFSQFSCGILCEYRDERVETVTILCNVCLWMIFLRDIVLRKDLVNDSRVAFCSDHSLVFFSKMLSSGALYQSKIFCYEASLKEFISFISSTYMHLSFTRS